MTLVLVSLDVRNKWPLRDSLHLSKIWRIEWHCSRLPDSSFVSDWVPASQMLDGELNQNYWRGFMPFAAKELKKEKIVANVMWAAFVYFPSHETCINSQIIHLCPPTQTFNQAHLIPQSYIPDLNPGHTSLHLLPPSTPPSFFQPPCFGSTDPSPALSLTPFSPSTPTYPPNLSGTGFPCPSASDGWGGRSSPHSPEFTDPISHADTSKSKRERRYWNHAIRVRNLALQNLLLDGCGTGHES